MRNAWVGKVGMVTPVGVMVLSRAWSGRQRAGPQSNVDEVRRHSGIPGSFGGCGMSGSFPSEQPAGPAPSAESAYPVKSDPTGRYLVDQI